MMPRETCASKIWMVNLAAFVHIASEWKEACEAFWRKGRCALGGIQILAFDVIRGVLTGFVHYSTSYRERQTVGKRPDLVA